MIHALVLFLAMQAATTSPADQHQEAGVAALKALENDKAIDEFKKAIELDKNYPGAYFGLGVAYVQKGDLGASIEPLKKALELDPTMKPVHLPLAYSLLRQGYAAESIPHFEKAGEREGLGIAQLETGDLTAAVQNLQAAAASKPGDPDLDYYLARATGLLSKQLFDQLVAVYPNSARTLLAEAESYAALRQQQLAEDTFKAALKARPDLPGAHLALGQFYVAASRWKEAEDEFRAEAKLRPGDAEAAYRLGLALLQGGNFAEARTELARANHLLPDMPETLGALGKAELQLGNLPSAEKAYKRVIEIEKNGPLAAQAHFSLSTIYRKQGKTEDAARETKLFQQAKQQPAPEAPKPAQK